MGRKILNGEKEFQSDSKWWELVIAAQKARLDQGKKGSDYERRKEEKIDPENPFGKNKINPVNDNPLEGLEHSLAMSGKYSLQIKDGPNPIDVDVYLDTNTYSKNDFKQMPPVKTTYNTPTKARMVFHPDHPAFIQFAENPHDYILMELAAQFSTRMGLGSEWNIGRCYQYLKVEFQPSEN